MSNEVILIAISAYFLVLVIIARLTSRQASNDTFFLGDKKSPWYLVAYGMIGASLSGITFISVPGGVKGGQFGYMQVVLGYLLGYFVVAYVLLPIYYKLNLISIYSYLEKRFGWWSYKTGAALFVISRVVGASIRLLLVASVLQLLLFDSLSVPFYVTVTISVALIWLYTNKGGIKTILWTDTLQTTFMLVALVMTIYLIWQTIGSQFDQGFFTTVANSDYSRVFFFEEWKGTSTFWKNFIGGVFITIGMTGLDQDMMQKNLSCKDLKSAQLNMVSFSIVLTIVNFVFLLLGAMLYFYYDATGIGENALNVLNRPDLLFAEIAQSGKLGLAVGLFFLLGLIAAAYSSADSALTSLTTSVAVDFLDFEKRDKESQSKLRKRVHFVMSIVLVLVVIVFRNIFDDSAIWLLITLAGFTYGPLIGLFFFGILTHRKLKDELVPWVSCMVSIVVGIIWFFAKSGPNEQWLFWMGNYKFGAELIVYNSILAFGAFYLISSPENKAEVVA